MEERPPLSRVAANILNKQSRTADKRGSSSLGLDEVLTTPHRKNWRRYKTELETGDMCIHKSLGFK
jgi:hypothetical protein